MKTGLSTIQQTLTPEAATVLNQSIAEASRRNHGQTTPLHVAATLLSSPSGYLRQACIRSHPNSSHPLQCRALELCFSVALERLPTTSASTGGSEPPISNALMAALKRAQAHQRRGCPEQNQQPLLAIKVELEQLIISILDDPSVSRVMREASFSSPAVKATIEQSLSNSNTTHQLINNQPHELYKLGLCSPNVNSIPFPPPKLGGGGGGGVGIVNSRLLTNPSSQLLQPNPIQNRNMYLNPRLESSSQQSPIPNRNMYLNPLLQHNDSPNRNLYLNPKLQGNVLGQFSNQRDEQVKKVIDVMLRTKKRNPVLVGEGEPESVIKELFRRIENGEKLLGNVHVIPLDKSQMHSKLNDLENLIETKIANKNSVILDLGDLKWLVEQQQLASESGRVIVMEMGKLLAKFRDNFSNKIWFIGTATCETYLRSQVYHPTMENDWDLQALPIASKTPQPGMFPRLGPDRTLGNPMLSSFKLAKKTNCCPKCLDKYEEELRIFTQEFNDKPEPARSTLPQWLQNAKIQDNQVNLSMGKDKETMLKNKSQELQKKWSDTCLRIHTNVPQGYNGLSLQPKSQGTLRLSSDSPPRSPIGTDLVLGQKENELVVKDFLGGPQILEKFANTLDADTYKKLLKGLMEKAWWQAEAASSVASAFTRCRLGNGKQRGNGGTIGASRGDIWLLFTGPDRIGKRKIATVLSEQTCGTGSCPVTINLGSRRDIKSNNNDDLRGKTVIDRITEAIRKNPFSVILLEDIDEADLLVRGSIKRAIDKGRLIDSHGREVSLGNVVFIVTGNWSTVSYVNERNECNNVNLKLTVMGNGKRRVNWLNEERKTKPRKEISLSLDLNLVADNDEEDRTDGSNNSSGLTVDHEEELGLDDRDFTITAVPNELVDSVDDAIVFKPIDLAFVKREIRKTITMKFSMIVDDKILLRVDDNALERIMNGIWQGKTSLEGWVVKVLGPSFERVLLLPVCENQVAELGVDDTDVVEYENGGDYLPSEIKIRVD